MYSVRVLWVQNFTYLVYNHEIKKKHSKEQAMETLFVLHELLL